MGKSREGRQSPYQDDLSAPPRPNNSIMGNSMVMSGDGTPTWTSVPARSLAKNACRYVSGSPTASTTTSAPLPSVSERMASTGSVVEASTTLVAPKRSAAGSFRASTSTAMTTRAPASAAAAMAALPTPPHPITATASPRDTPPVLAAAPKPAITPQPMSPAASGRALRSTGTHWLAATSVFSANAPIPRAGDRRVPSVSLIDWLAFSDEKQYHGRPRRQERHVPHGARQAMTT